MFTKGPQPGYSPKSEFLKICSTAFCRKQTYCLDSGSSITGYYIYLNEEEEEKKEHYATGKNSILAWEQAFNKWDTINSEYEKGYNEKRTKN